MTMQDPIADMLTRIRNAQAARKPAVSMPFSRLKQAVAEVLESEGYVAGHSKREEGGKPTLSIDLRYHEGRPVIEEIERVSRPSLRVYRGHHELPRVRGGLGVAIVSTSRGVMADRSARAEAVGGEIICTVF